jgi:amidase
MEPFVSEDAKRAMSFVLTPPKDLAGFIVDLTRRQGIAREWAVHEQQCPLVLGAVSTQPPFEVGRDVSNATGAGEVLRSMALTVVANLLGLPAAAVPTGVANGLPQGVQVMGPRYREDLCLDAAQAIEDRLGVITPIDPS